MSEAITICILTVWFVVGWCYLVLASLIADKFKNRHLPTYIFGYIIGAYAFAALLSSFTVSWFISRIGRTKAMYSGMLFMSISWIFLGLVPLIEDNRLMITATIICRLWQGFFKIFIQVTGLSIIIIIHPEDREKYIALFESAFGLGIGLGPVIGSVLYNLYGYFFVCLVISVLLLTLLVFLKICMPMHINDDDDERKSLVKNQHSSIEHIEHINYCGLLSDRIFAISTAACCMVYLTWWYFEPVLSFRLQDFTDSVYVKGLVFISMTAGYWVMALFIPCIVKNFDSMVQVTFGMMLWGIANFLIGPSIFLPDSLELMILGHFRQAWQTYCS